MSIKLLNGKGCDTRTGSLHVPINQSYQQLIASHLKFLNSKEASNVKFTRTLWTHFQFKCFQILINHLHNSALYFFSRAVVGSCSMRNGNKRPNGESNKHLGIVLHKKMAFPFSCGIRNRLSLEK